ncbi:MAG: hypothetical protein QNJ31_05805 [Candidatus Caenarcaniphilales bacterium]|nr:hypothetical protein [Candidatus Caenarcaniphilales bacterium]
MRIYKNKKHPEVYLPQFYRKNNIRLYSLKNGAEISPLARKKFGIELGHNGTFNGLESKFNIRLNNFLYKVLPWVGDFEQFIFALKSFGKLNGLQTNFLNDEKALQNIKHNFQICLRDKKNPYMVRFLSKSIFKNIFNKTYGILQREELLINDKRIYPHKYYSFLDNQGNEIPLSEIGDYVPLKLSFPILLNNYPEHFYAPNHFLNYDNPYSWMNSIQDALTVHIALESYYPESKNKFSISKDNVDSHKEKYWKRICLKQEEIFIKTVQNVKTPLDLFLLGKFSSMFDLELIEKSNASKQFEELNRYFSRYANFGYYGLKFGNRKLNFNDYANFHNLVENWQLYSGAKFLAGNLVLAKAVPESHSLNKLGENIKLSLLKRINSSQRNHFLHELSRFKKEILICFRTHGCDGQYKQNQLSLRRTLRNAGIVVAPVEPEN